MEVGSSRHHDESAPTTRTGGGDDGAPFIAIYTPLAAKRKPHVVTVNPKTVERVCGAITVKVGGERIELGRLSQAEGGPSKPEILRRLREPVGANRPHTSRPGGIRGTTAN